jgi:hypothetical protein
MLRLLFLIVLILTICCLQFNQVHAQHNDEIGIDKREYRLKMREGSEELGTSYTLFQSENYLERALLFNTIKPVLLKSLASSDYTLDSMVTSTLNPETNVTEKTRKQVLIAAENERTMLFRSYKWNEEKGHWIIDTDTYYYLSEQGRLDSLEVQKYITLSYRLYTKTSYAYTNGLLQVEETLEKFDEFDEWEKIARLEYQYDSIGTITRVSNLEWRSIGKRWSTYFYINYSYDSLQNLVSEVAFDYDDYEMVATKKYELQYEYKNNELERIVEFVKGWNDTLFVPERKQENAYDETSRLISKTYYTWDYDLGNWLEDERRQFLDSTAGTVIFAETTQNWENSWENEGRTEFHSFNSIKLEDLMFSDFIQTYLPVYVFENIICDQVYGQQWQDSDWKLSKNTAYYFSENPEVGIASSSNAQFSIYPNPVSDNVLVYTGLPETTICEIRDISGRLIYSEIFSTETQIQMQGFTPGIYILLITGESILTHSEKLIKY